jgi:hypothetical protein
MNSTTNNTCVCIELRLLVPNVISVSCVRAPFYVVGFALYILSYYYLYVLSPCYVVVFVLYMLSYYYLYVLCPCYVVVFVLYILSYYYLYVLCPCYVVITSAWRYVTLFEQHLCQQLRCVQTITVLGTILRITYKL